MNKLIPNRYSYDGEKFILMSDEESIKIQDDIRKSILNGCYTHVPYYNEWDGVWVNTEDKEKNESWVSKPYEEFMISSESACLDRFEDLKKTYPNIKMGSTNSEFGVRFYE